MDSLGGALVVERKYLLFQLDLKRAALRSLTGKDVYTDQAKPDLPGPFKFTDPMDWEDPTSPTYWRNILESVVPTGNQAVAGFVVRDVAQYGPVYTQVMNYLFINYKTNLLAAIGTDVVLRTTNGLPYRDISNLVRAVNAYAVSLEGFGNGLSLTIGPQDVPQQTMIAFRGQKSGAPASSAKSVSADDLAQANIGENDILMVRVSRDGGDFETEFIGFVTAVKQSQSHGSLDAKDVAVSGIAKLLEVSNIVKQQAIADPSQLQGINQSISRGPSVLSHVWQGKNAGEVFDAILSEVYAWRKYKPGEFKDGFNSAATLYTIDEVQFGPAGVASFQFNIFILITLYLMANTPVDPLTVGLPHPDQSHLFPAPNTLGLSTAGSLASTYMSKYAMAILEHGAHEVWNKTVASGFENFFSQNTKPAEILGELRETTYYDVFETRDGTLVTRPPRYNRIELSISEFDREFIDGSSPGSIPKILSFNATTGSYAFNPDADYYIPGSLLTGELGADRADAELETLAYAKWTMPYYGPIDFPSGVYQDPNLLIKYGKRSQGPLDNPNAINDNLAYLLCPVILGMLNAKTRTASATVWDTRDLRVGKLYYLEHLRQVALLVSDAITPNQGTVGKRQLGFSMVRSVVDIPIKDIQGSENARLNFALMYLRDPQPVTAAATATGGTATMKADLLARADAALTALAANTFGTGATVPMFRYVPTILDVIVDLDADPSLGKDQRAQDSVQIAHSRETFFDQAVTDASGQFYATDASGYLFGTGMSKTVADVQAVALLGFIQDKAGEAATAAAGFLEGTATGWETYNPRVGIVKYGQDNAPTYGPTLDGQSWPHAVYEFGGSPDSPAKQLPLVSTPFFVPMISADSGKWAFSQVLVNRLAALDLGMKFTGSGVPNAASGFPQYYGLDAAGNYNLFGSPLSATAYAHTDVGLGFGTGFGTGFGKFLFGDGKSAPNVLSYKGGAWSNDFFAIPGSGGGFNMPDGHLAYLSGGSLIPSFIKMTAGNVVFALEPSGGEVSVTITTSSLVVDEANLPTAGGYLVQPQTPGAATASVNDSKEVTITVGLKDGAPQMVFLSPYIEPTVERILELNAIPASIMGYHTATDSASLRAAAKSPRLLSENDTHVSGCGVDLCPDAVLYSSQSDLGYAPGGAANVATRFAQLALTAGFPPVSDDPSNPSAAYYLARKSPIVHFSWKLPNGGAPSAALPVVPELYFHLGVTGDHYGPKGNVLIAGQGQSDVRTYRTRASDNLAHSRPDLFLQKANPPSGVQS